MKLVRSVALVAIGATGLGFWLGRSPQTIPVEIVFLSVGQGDCAVVRTQNATVLIDAGPKSPSFDAGEQLIVPELRQLGVERIDLVILSHPDSDHIGGLAAILKRYPVRNVAIAAHFGESRMLPAALFDQERSPVNLFAVNSPQTVTIGGLRLDLIHLGPGEDDNAGSLCVRVQAGERPALFTGDLTAKRLEALLKGTGWKIDLLKAPHHGSSSGLTLRALRLSGARHVVVSCGIDNSYGHPAPDTLAEIDAAGAKAWRTDTNGAIAARPGPNGWTITTSR